MAIHIVCPSCGVKLRAPEEKAGHKTNCPKCGSPISITAQAKPRSQVPAPPQVPVPSTHNVVTCPHCGGKMAMTDHLAGRLVECPYCRGQLKVPKGDSVPQLNTAITSTKPINKASNPWDGLGETPATTYPGKPLSGPQEFDFQNKIAAWSAGAGLVLLALSPLFLWVNFATGGFTGLSGEGGIFLLVLTLITIPVYIAAVVTGKWVNPVILTIQAGGTLAVIWLGTLIWKVGRIIHSNEIQNNPFGAIFATQISPGAGLYVGLIGAVVVAGALGFIVVRRFLASGSLKVYYATQSLSCFLGIGVLIFVGPSNFSDSSKEKTKMANPLNTFFSESTEEQWKKTHKVSEKQWDELYENFRNRKYPSESGFDVAKSINQYKEWWEEAKDKTPAQLNKLYPPLKSSECYRAAWPSSGFSRKLDFNFGNRPRELEVEVMIRTERDVPIKELHGHLKFVKDKQIIYETSVTEKPNVSFTNVHFIFLRIPYDDSNPNHRTLRFTDEKELAPVFIIKKVVLADGTEKTFD